MWTDLCRVPHQLSGGQRQRINHDRDGVILDPDPAGSRRTDDGAGCDDAVLQIPQADLEMQERHGTGGAVITHDHGCGGRDRGIP